MTIALQITKAESGWPLTDSDSRVAGPWNTSREYRVATQQAQAPVVARVDSRSVSIIWSPESGLGNRADVWLDADIDSGDDPVTHAKIDWGDGSIVTYPNFWVPKYLLRATHQYSLAASSISVEIYNGASLLESQSIPFSPALSSWWKIQQFRIERFKGRANYALHYKRWIPDWMDFRATAGEMSFVDYDAPEAWNWGYRVWLRELDPQGRPDLIMVPSDWSSTGTGEGSTPVPVPSGWGYSWGGSWGST